MPFIEENFDQSILELISQGTGVIDTFDPQAGDYVKMSVTSRGDHNPLSGHSLSLVYSIMLCNCYINLYRSTSELITMWRVVGKCGKEWEILYDKKQ